MSGNGKQVQNTGVNQQGNEYRAYTDGSYAYKNSNSDGSRSGNYYNTGAGHAFYENKNAGYSFHENQNQGYRSYQSAKK